LLCSYAIFIQGGDKMRSKKHGVFIVNCFDNPRGYYWDVFYFGKWLGSFDYQSDAKEAFNKGY